MTRTDTTRRDLLFAGCLGLAMLVTAMAPSPVALAGSSGELLLKVTDRDTGQPIAVRMHLVDSKRRDRHPRDPEIPSWADHFVFDGEIVLRLPKGHYYFEMERGPEYLRREGYFEIRDFAGDTKEVTLRRFIDMKKDGWWSGDLDVRRPPGDVPLLMAAEDLHLAEVIAWSNRDAPGVKYPLRVERDQVPEEVVLTRDSGQRALHIMAGALSSPGAEVLLLRRGLPQALPAFEDEYPCPAEVLVGMKQQDAPWLDLTRPYWWDLPMLVANGLVDSVQIVHGDLVRSGTPPDAGRGHARDPVLYPDPHRGPARWSQDIYYRLLECGLRIVPTAASSSGMSENPVGYARTYVHIDGEFSYRTWWDNLAAGRVVVTNGPLLQMRVQGELPGHVFRIPAGQRAELRIDLTLSSRENIRYLQIIKNGEIYRSVTLDEYASEGRLPLVEFTESGWFLVRTENQIEGNHRFASTGPYYVEVGGQPRISKSAAQFFVDWVYERARQFDIPDAEKKREVIDYHRRGRDFFEDLVERANAP